MESHKQNSLGSIIDDSDRSLFRHHRVFGSPPEFDAVPFCKRGSCLLATAAEYDVRFRGELRGRAISISGRFPECKVGRFSGGTLRLDGKRVT